MNKRAKVAITGIVQGVGFRPFIYQLAHRHQLAGFVKNTAQGVDLEIEGPEEQIRRFVDTLIPERPPLAQISSIEQFDTPLKNDKTFEIRLSRGGMERSALISPDVCICDDCLKELTDPLDRRYRYPFINCTNCGPRYTIIQDIPYDRAHTTMTAFEMCPGCRAEYENPLNRRFHAQPNACHECGPSVTLRDRFGTAIQYADPVKKTISLLEDGKILAIKGLGGYHLAVDAGNHEAVSELRRRKHREEKPLALMVKDLETAGKICRLEKKEADLLASRERPIVIAKKNHPHRLSSQIAPGNRDFGVMLPYTPLHYLLMLEGGFLALVMTSGNMTEEPINIDNQQAYDNLGSIADYFLTHNRDIYLRSDDSILKIAGNTPRQIRRSRGYVPVPIFLSKDLTDMPSVLAVGAELKNTICLTKENRAFVSQHIGDMENTETFDFFQLTVSHLEKILEIKPHVLALDMHPDYLSSKFAREREDLPGLQVQHHHAHIVSCLAENGLPGPVIGLALDGTGLGTDGAVWGGEILVADLSTFRRVGHLDYTPLPGGDAAAKFPWRMALAFLDKVFGDDLFSLPIPFIKDTSHEEASIIIRMARRGINSPLTSSCGRLFDAVSSLAGIRHEVKYEGQAAIELDMAQNESETGHYPWHWKKADTEWVLSTSGIINGVVQDLADGMTTGVISRRFHNTLIRMFTETTLEITGKTGIRTVALSGGSFQNSTLLEGITRVLSHEGLAVFSHAKVPTNDGGLALGQAVCAGARYALRNPSYPYSETE